MSGCEEAAISRVALKKCGYHSRVARRFFRCMFIYEAGSIGKMARAKHSRSISQLYSRPKIFTADSVPR